MLLHLAHAIQVWAFLIVNFGVQIDLDWALDLPVGPELLLDGCLLGTLSKAISQIQGG